MRGAKSMRAFSIEDLESTDEIVVDRPTFKNKRLPAPVHELRRSEMGKALLRERGRRDPHVYRARDGLRPFLFWDGEGVTLDDGSHHYILFGSSSGHYIQGRSLGTMECLDLLLQCEMDNPDAYHVGFAFKYDVEMILFDLPRVKMERLHKGNATYWRNYRLEYFPGKWFQVSSRRGNKLIVCKVWDIFGYFQQSFVSALRDMFGQQKIFDEIASGKDSRSGFQYDDLESHIKPYWRNELEWGVKMVERLRELLYAADLKIVHWHGPGAIANFLFKKHNIKKDKNEELPPHITVAAQYAFTAGRFEPFKLGHACSKIYVYDLNSAHPTGMRQLPSLSGEWHKVDYPGQVSDTGIYRVSFDAFAGGEVMYDERLVWPQPIPHRDHKSLVSYPAQVATWLWSPELHAIKKHGVMKGKLRIHEAWELDYDPGYRPFDFIGDLYDKRLHYKRAGEHVQMAYKLGLNSLFGKTAQRVGWTEDKRKIPEWHQLEWAGLITSNTRALLWEAIMLAARKGSLVSVDTDAVFSTEPLDLPMGDGLGMWDYKVYDDMVYVQNGIYWLLKDGKWKQKFRGLDPDSLTVEQAIKWFAATNLRVPNPYTQAAKALGSGIERDARRGHDPMMHSWEQLLKIEGTTTRFIGSKAAFAGDESRRCRWETEPRIINVGTEGKRLHFWERCKACLRGDVYADNGFHDLTLPAPFPTGGQLSYPHFIPWRLLERKGTPWQDLQDEMFYT